MNTIRLPSGADARIVEWFDTDEFQASFCFKPFGSALQTEAKTWRTQTDTILNGLSASFGGFNNDLDVMFELEFVGGHVPPYRVPLFAAANGRPFAVPLVAQEGAEFTLRAMTNVVFAKPCVIKAMLTAAIAHVRHVPDARGPVCTCAEEHFARYPGVHLSACPLFK